MGTDTVGTPEDRKEFRRLVQEGRLFEIRDCVDPAHPSRAPPKRDRLV